MRFDILTIFPEAFESYFNISIVRKAQEKKIIKIYKHNLRQWADNVHKKIDDRPYGGGAGMIFKTEPIYKAVENLKKVKNKKNIKLKRKIILFSASGKKLTQKMAKSLVSFDQLILICPRYEGVDERVAKYIADEEISIGDYVLTGAELPAMILIDAVTRLIPGVIKEESLKEESFSFLEEGKNDKKLENNFCEYPQYTRPEIINIDGKKRKVPSVLLTGNHQKIFEWRKKHLKNKIKNKVI